MKHILVLGNGFDIAHGYDTKYEDFYRFCMILKKYNSEHIDDAIKKNLSTELVSKGFQKSAAAMVFTVKEKTLLSMIGVCKDNYWLNLMEIKYAQSDSDWCNIEKLIENEIILIDNVILKMGSTKYQYTRQVSLQTEEVSRVQKAINASTQSTNGLTKVKEFKKNIKNDLDSLTRVLNCYLSIFINKRKKQYPFFKSLPVDYIINFNYTDTYRSLYNRTEIPIHFIHGLAKGDDSNLNLVFGIGDSVEGLENSYDYIEFQKYYQRIVKKTGNDYVRWLDELGQSQVMNVYLFGHSVNVVDGDIIKRLIDREHSNIFIFYYDQEALNSIVLNLAKILGKEKLIEYTNKEKILFKESNLNREFRTNDSNVRHSKRVSVATF